MDRETEDRIRSRAGGRCEYCGIPEADSGLRFHIEHITARQHGGDDEDGNLGLACPDCNWRKGTNLTGIDPDSSQVTRLFHPRQDLWGDHFHAEVPRILGGTAEGRTTAWLLDMNSPIRLRHRLWLSQLGDWPPY